MYVYVLALVEIANQRIHPWVDESYRVFFLKKNPPSPLSNAEERQFWMTRNGALWNLGRGSVTPKKHASKFPARFH